MTRKRRVPAVLWNLFRNRAKTLAETILSLIPPPLPSPNQCRCKCNPNCLRCCSEDDRMSILVRNDDSAEYRKLVNQCFVVMSENAPAVPPFDPNSRWSQIEIVRNTIELKSHEKTATKNIICAGYNKGNCSSVVLEALTSASWSLLSQRVGDGLMVYLLRYSSIFMPLNRRKHHQVAGIPINDLCWDFLKYTSKSKNQQHSLETATKKRKHNKATKLKGPQNQNRVMKPDKNGTVPLVLWKFFKNRANTLAKTILSFIPPASPVAVKCRCKGSQNCLRCCSECDRMSFLLREDDPSDYRKLLSQCFVVSSDNAPLPPPFDPHCRWSQFEIVRGTIETTLQENAYTKNVICTGYNKRNRSSIVFEALTSASWSLLLQRVLISDSFTKLFGNYKASRSEEMVQKLFQVGDGLMFHLLKYSSIFMPLNRKTHHQVAGIPVNDLCRESLKHASESKNQQHSSETETKKRKRYEATNIEGPQIQTGIKKPSKNGNPESFSCLLKTSGVQERSHEVGSISMNIDTPESCMSSRVCNIKDSATNQQNEVLVVARSRSRKRLRLSAWRRSRKRMRLSSQNTCDENCSLSDEKMKSSCSCCSVWKTLQKTRKNDQISKRSILYKLEPASLILPGKHIINTLRPNVSGAKALFKQIFGFSDSRVSPQPTLCSHSSDFSATTTTCLYNSLHKLFKILIRKAIHCPRVKLLNKHIAINSIESDSSSFEHTLLDQQNLCCSKSKVVSFLWAACKSIVPRELLGSPSNQRILRKNISKFIRLRIYEKFSLHQSMYKLKISNFSFLSDNHSLCNSSTKQNITKRWIYWLFTCLVVPLLQANFYITDSENGRLEVFFYEKSLWEKLMKQSISSLKKQCYSLLDVNAVKKIIDKREFGFSRVRFRPKENGIRPLANLKSSSKLSRKYSKGFKAVNVVLRDLHAALKDLQLIKPEKLGSSVFSYNDVHRNFRKFLSHVKNGLDALPCVYMVVADVQKAYDSIDHDKLLHVMKEVITDDHLLHQTHQFVMSNGCMQVCQYVNLSRQSRSHVLARSSHCVLVNQGRCTRAMKYHLHFNLEQHVKYNVLHIDKRFYLQNVGIAQGSILSSLLCSFYLGHMENTKLVPFLDKVTETGTDSMLLRFIDDFIFISTSKKQAQAFFSRLERGFCEYNCHMNKDKFALCFDVDKISPQSNRLYIDENGNKFLRWSGLFINCVTLEVQADYTRYLDGHLSSTLTVYWEGNPVRKFREKVCDYMRPKCHPIFYDSNINSAAIVRLNIYQAFLLCAMKFHCYVRDLSDIFSFNSASYMGVIRNSLRFMYMLMKKRMYSLDVDTDSRPVLKVKKREVEWLGLTAYVQVLKRKQSRYTELLCLLESKLKLLDVARFSPALNFAADKSNSSVLWKIKY